MKATTLTRLPGRLGIALAITASAVLAATVAEARITRIDITSAESPTFGGTSFGTVGPYEKLRGTAYGEVDPADPRNALITDIELAPRTAGKVQYSMDIYILKPMNLSQGNNKLFLEVNNRGNKLFYGLNGSSGATANNPTTAARQQHDADQHALLRGGDPRQIPRQTHRAPAFDRRCCHDSLDRLGVHVRCRYCDPLAPGGNTVPAKRNI